MCSTERTPNLDGVKKAKHLHHLLIKWTVCKHKNLRLQMIFQHVIFTKATWRKSWLVGDVSLVVTKGYTLKLNEITQSFSLICYTRSAFQLATLKSTWKPNRSGSTLAHYLSPCENTKGSKDFTDSGKISRHVSLPKTYWRLSTLLLQFTFIKIELEHKKCREKEAVCRSQISFGTL